MKRLSMAGLTALVALTGWNAPAALAQAGDKPNIQLAQSSRDWRGGDDDDRDWRDDDRDWRDDDRDWRGDDRDRRDRDSERWRDRDHRYDRVPSWMRNDRLFIALQNTGRIRVNNFYQNGRYLTSGQTFRSNVVRLERILRDGTYEVWFNGNYYPAYTRTYRGKTLLYVGTAPTRQGYRYELILE